MNNKKGFTLVEVIIAVSVMSIIMICLIALFHTSILGWSYGESKVELNYNGREALGKLSKEISEANRVEILDSTDNGWIKIYKTEDESEYVTFRLKYNKLFIGYNRLDSNTELTTCLKAFKVEYLPSGSNINTATGAYITLKLSDNKNVLEFGTSICFRNK